MLAHVLSHFINGFITRSLFKKGEWQPVGPDDLEVQVEFPGPPKKPRTASAETPYGRAWSTTWTRGVDYGNPAAISTYMLTVTRYERPPEDGWRLLDHALTALRQASSSYTFTRDEPIEVDGFEGHEVEYTMKQASLSSRTLYLLVGDQVVCASAMIPTSLAGAAADDVEYFLASLRAR